MTDTNEFDRFYNLKLKSKLEELEEMRKTTSSIHNFKTYKRILLVLLVLIIIDVTLINIKVLPEPFFALVPISLVFTMFYPLVVLFKKGSNFTPINEEYKQRVIPELVSFVNSNLRYEKEKGITQVEFNRTRLFENASTFSSEDLITGEINGISYRMADVKAKRTHQYDVHSGVKTGPVTVFEGLYVIATYPKDLGPQLFIRYKGLGKLLADKVLDFLGEGASKLLETAEPKGISIETANSDFNALYNVKCENEDSAKAIITPDFINIMLTMNEKFNSKVAAAKLLQNPVNVFIQGSEVHIALFDTDVFDLNAFSSVIENNYTRKYYDFLRLSIELAETLK
jgi:hypothetical protein